MTFKVLKTRVAFKFMRTIVGYEDWSYSHGHDDNTWWSY